MFPRGRSFLRHAAKSGLRGLGQATARWRSEPTFLIVGTKRGGTTSLYRYLESHPAYVPLFPSATHLPMKENMKGVHYFDTNFDKGSAWYRSHFPSRRRCAGVVKARGEAFTGDASPYYLYHPLVAERAAHALPCVKLIALLRDPVERTISHWAEQRRNGVETLDLEEALAAESTRIGTDHERLASGTIATSFAHEHQSYASQSFYVESVRRWLSCFPPEQLLVRFSEELYLDPRTVVSDTCSFLGVSPHVPADLSARNAAPRTAASAPTREMLQQRFRPDALALEELLGRNVPWSWVRR